MTLEDIMRRDIKDHLPYDPTYGKCPAQAKPGIQSRLVDARALGKGRKGLMTKGAGFLIGLIQMF